MSSYKYKTVLKTVKSVEECKAKLLPNLQDMEALINDKGDTIQLVGISKGMGFGFLADFDAEFKISESSEGCTIDTTAEKELKPGFWVLLVLGFIFIPVLPLVIGAGTFNPAYFLHRKKLKKIK